MSRCLALLSILSVILAARASPQSALPHLAVADKLLNEERFQEAAAEYQIALKSNPRHLSARRDLAICRFELRHYKAARELLSDLLSHTSTAAMAHYYLGRIDLIEGNFDRSIAQFISIPHATPFRDERYFLGMAYYKSADWEDSAATLSAAIRDNPRDFRAHQLLARALQKLGREHAAADEFAETHRLLTYYAEGSQALKRCGRILPNGNPDEFAKVCEPLFATYDVDQLSALGMLLGEASLFEQAEIAWKRAAFLDPDSAEIRYDLALTCFHRKDHVCARDNAAAALRTRADFPEANVLYASVLYMMGVDIDALPALRKAHNLIPQDASIRQLLSNELILWAEQNAHTGNVANARSLLSELDQLRPLTTEQEQRSLDVRKLLD